MRRVRGGYSRVMPTLSRNVDRDTTSASRASFPRWVKQKSSGAQTAGRFYPEAPTWPCTVQIDAMCHKATYAQQKTVSLFDHLVGTGEDRGRDGKAKHFGSLEVDNQIEL